MGVFSRPEAGRIAGFRWFDRALIQSKTPRALREQGRGGSRRTPIQPAWRVQTLQIPIFSYFIAFRFFRRLLTCQRRALHPAIKQCGIKGQNGSCRIAGARAEELGDAAANGRRKVPARSGWRAQRFGIPRPCVLVRALARRNFPDRFGCWKLVCVEAA